jgi:hypothetical protein
MKKILFGLIILLLISCNTYRSFYLMEKDYNSKQGVDAIEDVYASLKAIELDSIPLNDWMTFQGQEGNGYFIQRVIKKSENKTDYVFIFTTYYNDSTYYNYKIRCRTKDKDLWKGK